MITASCIFFGSLPLALLIGDDRIIGWLFHAYLRAWIISLMAWVRHHGPVPRLKKPHLFVANHTSFLDWIILSGRPLSGTVMAVVAQLHGGVFGWLQRRVLSSIGSLTFQRDEARDRRLVARRMREHVIGKGKASQFPLLIFPEGTCVNNEATVMFHRGAFDLPAGTMVCPVAIRYHKQTFDPYWNTREQTFTQHLAYLITRWFLVVDVWWLPPQQMRSEEGEDAYGFASRVKSMISQQAGLLNLQWNGYLKNASKPQDRERMRRTSQCSYVQSLRERIPSLPLSTQLAMEYPAEFLVGSLPAHLSPPPFLMMSPPLSPTPCDDVQPVEELMLTWRQASKQEGREMRRQENASWRQWHLQQQHRKKDV